MANKQLERCSTSLATRAMPVNAIRALPHATRVAAGPATGVTSARQAGWKPRPQPHCGQREVGQLL